jgi:hypothetical protein
LPLPVADPLVNSEGVQLFTMALFREQAKTCFRFVPAASQGKRENGILSASCEVTEQNLNHLLLLTPYSSQFY